jgi:ATP-binding cassette subfamily B protein
MARASNDLEAIRMVLGPGLMYTFSTFLVLVASLALMIRISPELTLWAFAPLPFLSAAVAVVMRLIHDRILRVQEGFANLTTRARESFAGIRVIKSFAREESQEAEFARVNEDVVERNLALARVQRVFFPSLGLFTGAALALVLGKGGVMVMNGALTIGEFVAFTSYLFLLMWPMAALGWTINLFHRGRASWQRVNELLCIATEPLDDAPAPPGRGALELRGVRLERGSRTILDGVDLDVQPGEIVALVGATGAGKSSLLRLLARLTAPSEGEILLDGEPITEWNLVALRRSIAFVPQDAFLFSDSIAANLELGDAAASRERIREAATRVRLVGEIDAFARGFDTVVGERGVTLSGGQRQRVTLARALLRSPRLLLLDDAFSSMDAQTEESILGDIAPQLSGRTVLFVSHRLSTIRRASRIVVLEHGRIVEDGTHDALLEAKGAYARFVRRQRLVEELEAEDSNGRSEVA